QTDGPTPVTDAEGLALPDRQVRYRFPGIGLTGAEVLALPDRLTKPLTPVTWRRRLEGAGHIICILSELQGGFHKATLYLQKLREDWPAKDALLSEEAALRLASREYGFYRLVSGLIERRVAILIGQI